MRRAALEHGWTVERLQSYRVSDGLQTDDIALYGEALFTTIIADQLGYALLEVPADWLTTLPFDYMKRHIQFTTLGEARQQLSKSVFIKPAEGKSFAAQIYHAVDELPEPASQPANMPVFVAEPVQWAIEFRCFIMERKLATLSVYTRNGEIAEVDGQWQATNTEIAQATGFCEKLLQNKAIEMPPAFVLDIGAIVDRGWAVIEANPAWASGIYGCDTAKILPVLKRSCVVADTISSDDKRWQLNRFDS